MEALFILLTFLTVGILVLVIIGFIERPQLYTDVWRFTTGKFLGKRHFGVTYNQVRGMSGEGRRSLRVHNELPPQHRLDVDVLSILKTYDLKNGGAAKVDAHFSNYRGDCNCRYWWDNDGNFKTDCTMGDYAAFRSTIGEIKTAVSEQQEALERAAVAGVVNNMPLLIERAREEAAIIKSTTKEIS